MKIKFYKESDGEIIAVIPEPQERPYKLIYSKSLTNAILNKIIGDESKSNSIAGQYGQATKRYISTLKKATEEESKNLKAELKAIGYTNF